MDIKDLTRILTTPRSLSWHKRWGTYNFGFHDSVSSHSWYVTFYADTIRRLEIMINPDVKIDELKLFKIAIYHDIPESITSDINHVVKSYIRRHYGANIISEIDDVALDLLMGDQSAEFKDLTREMEDGLTLEGKIVKAADILESVVYLLDEKERGSRCVDTLIAENTTRLKALCSDLPSVELLVDALNSINGAQIQNAITPDTPGRV